MKRILANVLFSIIFIALVFAISCEKGEQSNIPKNTAPTTTSSHILPTATPNPTEIPQNTVPPAHNTWLIPGDLTYKVEQEMDNSWQQTFHNGGIVTINKCKVSCVYKNIAVEYACFTNDKKYSDSSIEWLPVQHAEFNQEGISNVVVNAFLDYGSSLVEGQAYRLAVRTVTENNNYILNIYNEFVYQHYNTTLCENMLAAVNFIGAQRHEARNEAELEEVLKSEIGGNLDFDITLEGTGGDSNYYTVVIKYPSNPAFTYKGSAFTVKNVCAWYDNTPEIKGISLVAPTNGKSDFVLAQDWILSHFTNPYESIIDPDYEYYSEKEICTPTSIRFEWTNTETPSEDYYLLISKDMNFSNPLSYKTRRLYYEVYNLQPGTKYYWKISCGDQESPVQIFTVALGYTRFLKVNNVQNLRDLGGYITEDGRRVKYGLLYRSANLDSIDKNGRTELKDRLGIKTDMDFRNSEGTSPLGEDVKYIPIPIKWYHGIFTDEALPLIRQAIAEFAKEENYPMLYHCAVGRDRTGTMSILILGLLGVDEETLIREYHLSFYSEMGEYSPEKQTELYQGNIIPFLKGLRKYGDSDDTIQEIIEKFMLKIGVTQNEINSIRTILLEDMR